MGIIGCSNPDYNVICFQLYIIEIKMLENNCKNPLLEIFSLTGAGGCARPISNQVGVGEKYLASQ